MEKSYCPFTKPFISSIAVHIVNSNPQFKGMEKKFIDILSSYAIKEVCIPTEEYLISEEDISTGNSSDKASERSVSLGVNSENQVSSSRKKSTALTTSKKATSKNKNTCSYILTRGINKGGPCGKIAKFEFEGKWYCGTSREGENGEAIYQGHIRTAHISSEKGSNSTTLKSPVDEIPIPEIKARELLFKMSGNNKIKIHKHPKFDVYYHRLSNLAVNPTKSVVLGNINEDGTLGPLTSEQKRICETNNWVNNYPEDSLENTPIIDDDGEDDDIVGKNESEEENTYDLEEEEEGTHNLEEDIIIDDESLEIDDVEIDEINIDLPAE